MHIWPIWRGTCHPGKLETKNMSRKWRRQKTGGFFWLAKNSPKMLKLQLLQKKGEGSRKHWIWRKFSETHPKYWQVYVFFLLLFWWLASWDPKSTSQTPNSWFDCGEILHTIDGEFFQRDSKWEQQSYNWYNLSSMCKSLLLMVSSIYSRQNYMQSEYAEDNYTSQLL